MAGRRDIALYALSLGFRAEALDAERLPYAYEAVELN
jgi:hypothetical protein